MDRRRLIANCSAESTAGGEKSIDSVTVLGCRGCSAFCPFTRIASLPPSAVPRLTGIPLTEVGKGEDIGLGP